MADNYQLLGALGRFLKNTAMTAHAMGAAPLLERVAENADCVDECAQAAAAADQEVWSKLSADDRRIYTDMAKAVLKAQAKWYKREVHDRLRAAVMKVK